MERTNFEKLQVYQLSEKLADGIWKVVLVWNPFARDTVGKQIVRSADGVGANIAEVAGEEALWIIAVSSEWPVVRYMKLFTGLRRAYVRGLLSQAEVRKLRVLVEELSPKLNAYLRSVDQRAK